MEQVSIMLEKEKIEEAKIKISPLKITNSFGEGEPTQGFGGK